MEKVNKSSQTAINNFIKTFDILSYRHTKSIVFDDFLTFSILMFNFHKTPQMFAEFENKYTAEEGKLFAELFINFSIAADYEGLGFYDCLGDIFMECFYNNRTGQFFTPVHVCDMMALMTIGNPKDGQSVVDSCCGSGRMLLSAAKINRNLNFYAADIDERCCKMTVLNMLINTMQGEVAHMNSITMEHYKSWHIKKYNFGGVFLPIYHITDKNQTNFIQKLNQTQEAKPDLTFDTTLKIGSQMTFF